MSRFPFGYPYCLCVFLSFLPWNVVLAAPGVQPAAFSSSIVEAVSPQSSNSASNSDGSSVSTDACSAGLIQALGKIGWIGSKSNAFHATGTLTHNPGITGQLQSNTTVWADTAGSYRSEIENGGVSRVTVAVNGRGLRKSSTSSKSSYLSPQSVQSAQQWITPWLMLSQQLPLHDCSQPEIKSSTTQGLAGYRFQPNNSMRDLKPGKQHPLYDTTFTLWMNPASALPDHIDFFIPASDNPYAGTAVSRYFSKFEAVDGVMIPRVEELVAGGNIVTRLQFDQVELIDKLSSSLFSELQGSRQ